MVTYMSYSELFSWVFFEIIWSDCLAQLTEIQTEEEKAEVIKKKLKAP